MIVLLACLHLARPLPDLLACASRVQRGCYLSADCGRPEGNSTDYYQPEHIPRLCGGGGRLWERLFCITFANTGCYGRVAGGFDSRFPPGPALNPFLQNLKFTGIEQPQPNRSAITPAGICANLSVPPSPFSPRSLFLSCSLQSTTCAQKETEIAALKTKIISSLTRDASLRIFDEDFAAVCSSCPADALRVNFFVLWFYSQRDPTFYAAKINYSCIACGGCSRVEVRRRDIRVDPAPGTPDSCTRSKPPPADPLGGLLYPLSLLQPWDVHLAAALMAPSALIFLILY